MSVGLLDIQGDAAQQPQEHCHGHKFRCRYPATVPRQSRRGFDAGIRARSLVLRGVKARAPEIYARLVDGSMPCDQPWPPDRLGFFRLWMDEGCAP
jgi:hypothetical protein